MARTTDELWGNDKTAKREPRRESAPETPAAEPIKADALPESTETVAAEQTKPAPVKADAAKPQQPPQADESDEAEEHIPDNLDGLKRALAAARGDKRKARKQWQETDRQLAELRGRMAALQQQAAPKPAEPTKPETKPEDDFYANPVEFVRGIERKAVEAAQSRLRQFSIANMRNTHPDFDQVVGEFVRDIAQTPMAAQLAEQEAQHPDPARFMYETARQFSQVRGVKSVDELREKLRAELRAEIEAERNSPAAAAASKPIPQSLAGVRANGASAPAAWRGPRSEDELWGR